MKNILNENNVSWLMVILFFTISEKILHQGGAKLMELIFCGKGDAQTVSVLYKYCQYFCGFVGICSNLLLMLKLCVCFPSEKSTPRRFVWSSRCRIWICLDSRMTPHTDRLNRNMVLLNMRTTSQSLKVPDNRNAHRKRKRRLQRH